jgi:tetratricopeptide (TPR) repeat protein
LEDGLSTEGVAELEKAVTLSSSDPEVTNDAAFLLADVGVRLDLAAVWAEGTVRKLGGRLRETRVEAFGRVAVEDTRALFLAWDTLGWVRFKEGRLDDAERFLRAAEAGQLASGMGWPDVADHLGQVLEQAGRPGDAIEAYSRALKATHPPDGVRARLARIRDERAGTAVGDAPPSISPSIRSPCSAVVVDTQVVLVLSAGGQVVAVLPQVTGPLPAGLNALVNARHSLPVPDDATDKLAVAALVRCAAGWCVAELPQPP